jgi:hypothetical protein
MLNININRLTNSYTFSPHSNEWAHNNYLERDVDESIDDAIRRLIPNEGQACHAGNFLRSPQQIEEFIRAFHNLEPGADIDYSALIEDWQPYVQPIAIDADHFFDQVQEFEESYFRDQAPEDIPDERDYEDEEEYGEAYDAWNDNLCETVEQESAWAVQLITHLELWRAAKMWKAMRSDLVVGELYNLHDNEGRSLVAVYLGRLEVLVDGVVIDIAVDGVKIVERLSLLSLAA